MSKLGQEFKWQLKQHPVCIAKLFNKQCSRISRIWLSSARKMLELFSVSRFEYFEEASDN